jgi:DNA invertase Pin-like site-specific DNA recombinase
MTNCAMISGRLEHARQFSGLFSVYAGIARARDQGTQLGRRRLEDTDAKKVAAIRSARKKGVGVRRIARDLGVGVGTALRLTAEA